MDVIYKMYQIGTCNNYGACCYIYSPKLGHYHLCEQYDPTKEKHCRLYMSKKRPKQCRDFPRGPADLENVKEWCSIRFVDEKGNTIDGCMDKRVKLVPV